MAETPDHADVRILPPVLFLASILLGAAIQWLLPLSFASGSTLRMALGAALVPTGLLLGYWAFVTMRRTAQDPDPRQPSPELIPGTGPYRFTRNPMYVGMALIQIGVGIAFGSVWILLLLPPTLLILQRNVIEREEEYLTRKFGDAYRAYQTQTRRWV